MFSEAHFRSYIYGGSLDSSPRLSQRLGIEATMVVPKERRLIHETNQRLGRAVSLSRFRVKSGVETTPVLSKNN